MEEEGTQNARLLKVIVIVLGILIVIMMAVMIGTIAYRLFHSGEETAKVETVQPASSNLPTSSNLEVPPGSTIKTMVPGDRELYLHVTDGTGTDHIYALDRRSGALLWHRTLAPAQ